MDFLKGGKSNKTVAKTPKQEANDLVTELIGIWKSRGDRMMIGANKRIDDIVALMCFVIVIECCC